MKILAALSDPKILRAFHGWCTFLWIPVTVLAFYLGWLQSVTFVSLVSMLALFLGSFSSWQSARTETKQDADIESIIDDREDVERT